MEKISVRQWQEQFRAGAFNDKSVETQCKAGWYDWFCQNDALAGRLKKIAKVVMGITEPFILDNYYVWFKNNCPMSGPLYDDVRFEPLSGERGGKYFLVALDSPHETKKWALITERYGYSAPEFECGNVRDMIKYIGVMAGELERGVVPAFIAEKNAVKCYVIRRTGYEPYRIHREGDHCFSYRSPVDRQIKSAIVRSSLENLPEEVSAEQAEKIGGLYVLGQESPSPIPTQSEKQTVRKRKGQER